MTHARSHVRLTSTTQGWSRHSNKLFLRGSTLARSYRRNSLQVRFICYLVFQSFPCFMPRGGHGRLTPLTCHFFLADPKKVLQKLTELSAQRDAPEVVNTYRRLPLAFRSKAAPYKERRKKFQKKLNGGEWVPSPFSEHARPCFDLSLPMRLASPPQTPSSASS